MSVKKIIPVSSPARKFILNPVSEKRIKESFERAKRAERNSQSVFVEVK